MALSRHDCQHHLASGAWLADDGLEHHGITVIGNGAMCIGNANAWPAEWRPRAGFEAVAPVQRKDIASWRHIPHARRWLWRRHAGEGDDTVCLRWHTMPRGHLSR